MRDAGRDPIDVILAALITAALVAALLLAFATSHAASPAAAIEYVCPPCDAACDDRTHERPGRCEVCNMRLVRKDHLKTAAILLFDGVQIIDYTGPYEVFGHAGFRVYTVSEKGETITTAMGMSVNPTYSFESAPAPDILLLPGGDVDDVLKSEAQMAWVRQRADAAEYVLSVCNGAFILAKTGLLDGRQATTFYGLIDALQESRPAVRVVRDRRFADNGKLITSAGLSSGIDAAIHLVSRVFGHGKAQQIALHMEYDWRPDADWARAALADMLIPRLDPPVGMAVTILSTEGDRDHWTKRWALDGEPTAAEVFEHANAALAKSDGWSRVGSEAGGEDGVSRWAFRDRDGRPWTALLRVAAVESRDGSIEASFEIERGGAAAQARRAPAPSGR